MIRSLLFTGQYFYRLLSISDCILKSSALIALHMPWLYDDHVPTVDADHSQRAKAVIQDITNVIRANLIERQCFSGRDPEDTAPWGLFFAYHICGVHIWASSETPSSLEVVRSLRESFRMIDVRWNAAGTFPNIPDHLNFPET